MKTQPQSHEGAPGTRDSVLLYWKLCPSSSEPGPLWAPWTFPNASGATPLPLSKHKQKAATSCPYEPLIFSVEITGPGAIKLLWEKPGPQRLKRVFSSYSHLRVILLMRNRPTLPASLSITGGHGETRTPRTRKSKPKGLRSHSFVSCEVG